MKLGEHKTGIVIFLAWLAMSSFMAFMPQIMGGPPLAPGATDLTIPQRFMTVGMEFGTLPKWVSIWMGWQHFVFASALLFVIWHKEAQLYLLGLLASHAVMFTTVAFGPMNTEWLLLASFTHWLWIPALLLLLRNWISIPKNSGFWLWSTMTIGQLCFSLFFDIPDGVRFLGSLL